MKKILFILIIVALWVAYDKGLFDRFKKENVNNNDISLFKNNNESLTYTNDKYGYKINYPNNFYFKENISGSITFSHNSVNLSNVSNPGPFEVRPPLYFATYSNDYKNSAKDWFEENNPYSKLSQIHERDIVPDETKELTIAGEKAYYLLYDKERNAFGDSKFALTFYYVPHGENIFQISGIDIPKDTTGISETELVEMKEYKKIFDDMLASFQFTR